MNVISQAQTGRGQQQAESELEQNIQEAIESAMRAAQNAQAEANAAAIAAGQTQQGETSNLLAPNVPQIPPQVTDIMLIGVLGVIGMILAFPIGRAIARWIDRRGAVAKVPDNVASRLAAIENGVQAVAVEVERLSETNRYTARLLTERVSAPDFRAGEAREATPESVPPRSTWQAS